MASPPGTTPSLPDALAHLFTGGEVRHIFRRDRDRFSTFWVAPGASWTVAQREASEATDFDAMTL
jgi:hypothetical protein